MRPETQLPDDAALLSALRRFGVMHKNLQPDVEELQNALALLDAILSGAGQAIIFADATGRVRSFNRAAERMLGYTADEVVGRVHTDQFHDLDELRRDAESVAGDTGAGEPAPGISVATLRARRGHLPEGRDWTWIRKDGTRVRVHLTLTALTDEQDQIVGFVGVADDITERARAEAALRRSESRFRAVQEATPDGFMILESIRDPGSGAIVDFSWVFVNDAAARIVGRPRDSFIGKRLLEEMPGNRIDGLFDAYVAVIETGVPWHSEFTYAHDGVNVYLRTTAAKVGDGFAVSFADLSDRRAAELELARTAEALRAATETLQATYDTAPIGLCVLDTDLRYVRVNACLAEINGFTPAEHIGKTVMELLPSIAPEAVAILRRVVETGEPVLGLEIFGETPARPGVIRSWLENWLPMRDAAGRITGINIVAEEVTEQRARERELREKTEAVRVSEERFRIVAEVASDAVWDWDIAADTLWWNDGFHALFGYTPEQVRPDIGWWQEHIHPSDRDRILAEIDAAVRGDGDLWSAEYRFRRADGSWATIFDKGRVLRSDDGRALRMLGAMQDVTEQREIERRERFLVELSERTRALTDPDAVLWETVAAVGAFLNPARCTFVDIDADSGTLTVRRDWTRANVPSVAGSVPMATFGAAPLDVLRGGDPLVIADVGSDERIPDAHRDAYTARQIASLVSIPIQRAGRLIGILGINETEPRVWRDHEVTLLQAVAERAWLALENARLWREREAEARKNERIAETLQRSLLVTPDPSALPDVEIGTEYQAAWDEALIGGDFFDAFPLDGDTIALVVGDATGKGLKAAEHIAEVKYALRAFLRENPDPSAALRRLNAFTYSSRRTPDLSGDGDGGAYVAVEVAVLDTRTGVGRCAASGMEPPLLLRAGTDPRAVEPVDVGGTLIGALPDADYDIVEFDLRDGDVLAMGTDGITEARNGGGDFFGGDGMARSLRNAVPRARSLMDAARAVVGDSIAFADGKRADDMCLLLVRRHGT